jgi:hypothetical protein
VVLYFDEGPSVQVLKQNYNSNFDSENWVPHKLNRESSSRFGSSKNNYSDSRFGTSFQSQTWFRFRFHQLELEPTVLPLQTRYLPSTGLEFRPGLQELSNFKYFHHSKFSIYNPKIKNLKKFGVQWFGVHYWYLWKALNEHICT